MENKKISLLLVSMFFVLAVTLIGCSKNSLSGTYNRVTPTVTVTSFTFKRNGTVDVAVNQTAISTENYTVNGKSVEIFHGNGENRRVIYQLELDGNTLTGEQYGTFGRWRKE